MSDNITLFTSMEDLLNSTYDSLAKLPPEVTLPEGSHKVDAFLSVSAPKKGDKEPKMFINLKLKYKETLELADQSATLPEQGSEANISFNVNNKYGQNDWAILFKELCDFFGVTTFKEVSEKMEHGVAAVVTTGIRKDEAKGKQYNSLVAFLVER